MSLFEDLALIGRAFRPDELQYFIHFTSRARPGLQVVPYWSPNSLDCVRQAFLYEFALEQPTVLFITCPGGC